MSDCKSRTASAFKIILNGLLAFPFYQSHDDGNHGGGQQQVDQAAGYMVHHEADEPANKKNHCDDVQ